MISSLTALICVVFGFVISALLFKKPSEIHDDLLCIDDYEDKKLSKECDDIKNSDLYDEAKIELWGELYKDAQKRLCVTQGERRCREDRRFKIMMENK